MKLVKFAFVCAAVASLTAVADDDVSSTLALMKVDNVNNLHVVPVGINFAAADGTQVSVSNAVKTAGLPSGTRLYVYDATAGMYCKYQISGNYWVPEVTVYVDAGLNQTETEAADAASKKMPAGSAAFLVFPSSETPSNIIVAGKPVSASESSITTGANLCCFPVGKAVNLNQKNSSAADYAAPLKASPTVTQFVEGSNKTAISSAGDTIVVPKSDTGASRVFYFDGTSWGYIGKVNNAKTFITDDANLTIPGGIGFWYNSVSAQ